MADEEKIVFSIDLDTKSATVKVSDLKNAMQGVGKTSMQGATDGLKDIAVFAGQAYAAFKTLHVAWEAMFEADRLKAIDVSFKQLTKTFGISTETLRKGLEKASDGLVDTTDLLEIANRSMVAMGAEAARLPQIMEIARKASVITGQDVAETFEGLANAIATGNTKALKQMGLVIDVDKAYKEYSKTLGYNSDVLSQAGKQHALLNAVIAEAETSLSGTDLEVKKNTNSWARFKTTLNDVKDVITIAFEKVMGPQVRKFIDLLDEGAQKVKTFFQALGGDGAEQVQAEIKITKGELEALKNELAALEKRQESPAWYDFTTKVGFTSAAIEVAKSKIVEKEKALAALEERLKTTGDAAAGAAAKIGLHTLIVTNSWLMRNRSKKT
jgi:hypothetical protein